MHVSSRFTIPPIAGIHLQLPRVASGRTGCVLRCPESRRIEHAASFTVSPAKYLSFTRSTLRGELSDSRPRASCTEISSSGSGLTAASISAMSTSVRTHRPPLFSLSLARAFSTRIRRMASAAAQKNAHECSNVTPPFCQPHAHKFREPEQSFAVYDP